MSAQPEPKRQKIRHGIENVEEIDIEEEEENWNTTTPPNSSEEMFVECSNEECKRDVKWFVWCDKCHNRCCVTCFKNENGDSLDEYWCDKCRYQYSRSKAETA